MASEQIAEVQAKPILLVGFDGLPCNLCEREEPCDCGHGDCQCSCGRCSYPHPLPDDGPDHG